jgi:hypothetical protein
MRGQALEGVRDGGQWKGPKAAVCGQVAWGRAGGEGGADVGELVGAVL